MSRIHLIISTCLLSSVCLDALKSTKVKNHKGKYSVCDTEVCVRRAKLISESLNTSVDPCDDFYSYACGGWMATHSIPGSESSTGSLDLLNDELQKTLKDILENMAPVYEDQNVSDKAAVAYNACLAVPTSKDRRDVAIKLLNESGIAQWPAHNESEDHTRNFGNNVDVLSKTGILSILQVSVGRDAKNLTSRVIQLDQVDFRLVGRNQLIHPQDEYNKPIINAYKNVIRAAMKFMTPNLREDLLTKLSNELVDFEGRLANLTVPPEERRNLKKIYHRTTIKNLQRNFSNVPLLNLLRKEFSKANVSLNENETVEIYGLDYYRRLNDFLQTTKPDTLYNYAGLQTILDWVTHVSKDTWNASLELSKVSSGVLEETPRWKVCVGLVNSAMREVVGYHYVLRKFSGNAKKEVEDLVSKILGVFKDRLQEIQWMDNETRKAAEQKLRKMGLKIGYPEWLFNKTYVEECYRYVPALLPNTAFAEILYRIATNHWIMTMLKLRQPYDNNKEWVVGPAVLNAFYNPNSNEMVYPSGVLQGVFYEHGLPRSINFGAIGMVVGHEMTHGFDDTGSEFDADGALKQWWTNDTRSLFLKKSKCFEYQYGNITDDAANMKLNGKNTLGENIADNGGLRMAFKAYERFLKNERRNDDTRLSGLEHLSGRKLFFIANAMVWCSLARPQHLKLQIQYDPHSPSHYRVNVPMANMPAFAAAFKCPKNSLMNKKKRCTLW
ncbi:neprilysin-1-like [Dermacentor albipictus]|uniref:neprilysin-1-like n=1 Tax=Dermacentor albipictus TaxID=60249 RepID=UPI0038FC6BD8